MAWIVRLVVGLAALVAIVLGIAGLRGPEEGIRITDMRVGETPVFVYRGSDATGDAPLVVIAHGFAGSATLMRPFALTLARAGYVALTYDALGHAGHAGRLTGDLMDPEGATVALRDQLAGVIDAGLALPGTDGRLALLAHSMSADIIVRQAMRDPRVAASVAVSMYSPVVTASQPGNLLMIPGAWEGPLTAEAMRVLALHAGAGAEAGTTYGDPDAGTARRVSIAPGVEHVGVLYSRTALAEARAWLDTVFGRTSVGPVPAMGWSVALLFAGVTVLAWSLVGLAPRLRERREGVPLGWWPLAGIAALASLVTPTILWLLPTDILPVLIADYLALHFALFGLLLAAGLRVVTRRLEGNGLTFSVAEGVLVLVALVFCLAAFVWPIDWFLTHFHPTAERAALFALMILSMLAYFLADAWATGARPVPRGAGWMLRIAFLFSLGFAVGLDMTNLFFLLLIVPVILVFFGISAVIGRFVERRTGSPWPGAVAAAVMFAVAVASTFPRVG